MFFIKKDYLIMNVINKSRLTHLGNTTHIATGTHLSPKFWAKCAAIISSMAVMEANADNMTVTNSDVSNALVISQKLSTSNTITPASLTLAGAGVKIIDNNFSGIEIIDLENYKTDLILTKTQETYINHFIYTFTFF